MDLNKSLDFYKRVLPHTGNYFIGSQVSGARKFLEEPAGDLLTLVSKIDNRATQHRDIWFSVGSFGNTRRGVDARFKRSFYVDVDCGPGKPYPTIKAGLKEFTDLCVKHNIPRPTIV